MWLDVAQGLHSTAPHCREDPHPERPCDLHLGRLLTWAWWHVPRDSSRLPGSWAEAVREPLAPTFPGCHSCTWHVTLERLASLLLGHGGSRDSRGWAPGFFLLPPSSQRRAQ